MPSELHEIEAKCNEKFNNLNTMVGKKVPWQLFIVILIFVIGSLSTLIGITYSKADNAQAAHKDFVTQPELIELKSDLIDRVDKVEEQVKDTRKEIKGDIKDTRKEIKGDIKDMKLKILNAIKK